MLFLSLILPYPHPDRINPWGPEPAPRKIPEPDARDLEGEIDELHRRNHILIKENQDLMMSHRDLQCKIGTLQKALDKAKLVIKKAKKTVAKLKIRIGVLQKFTRFDAMILDEE